MSYAIMRAIKVKTASDVVGCEIHNERLKDHSNSNPDIDFDKAKDDYQIGEYRAERYNRRIDRAIRERYNRKKAIRKDATRCIELMFTSDGDFFKGLTQEQEKAYFKDCYEFAVAHFGGRANIIGDKVHKDEETPHMHLDIVPLTADGRLSAKEFLGGKRELQALQDKFYDEVGKKWGLERGNRADLDKGESGVRHKTQQEMKAERKAKKLEEKIKNGEEILKNQKAEFEKTKAGLSGVRKELETEKRILSEAKNTIKKGSSWCENLTGIKLPGNKILISQGDFEELKNAYEYGVKAKTNLQIEQNLHYETKDKLEKAESWKYTYYAYKEEHKDDIEKRDKLEKMVGFRDRKILELEQTNKRLMEFIEQHKLLKEMYEFLRPKREKNRSEARE